MASAKSGYRIARVAENIQQEVAKYLVQGFEDPRLGFVTVTHVTVANDLKHAKIFFLAQGTEAAKKESKDCLLESKNKIRHHLARSLGMRFVPDITLEEDTQLEEGFRIHELLRKISDAPAQQ